MRLLFIVLSIGQATGQAIDHLKEEVKRVIYVTVSELKSSEIMEFLDLKHREYFRDAYLLPAIEAGLIEMTLPDKPNSPNQRYRLTDKGIVLQNKLNAND